MTTHTALIGLWAETSIHAGAGGSVDGIDLPIQRESHSGYPCIFGSAVKGALRAKAEDKLGENNSSISYVFGLPSTSDSGSDYAGALLVSDARLLLLPVRSLTSHFKWVTCPALLERLLRDGSRLGIELNFAVPQEPEKQQALAIKEIATDLFLEEYRLTTKQADFTAVTQALHELTGIEKGHLDEQCVIVSNDLFSYLSKYSTAVTAHIAIDNETKTVKPGALWYEETLPAESVLYFALSAYPSRAKDSKMSAEVVLNSMTTDLLKPSPYLQLGGNETVGMGWCKVNVLKKEA
ncbi:MAG: type III-B CRISPR module RAMP protein Cmr4 [Methylobacter sp.]|nr:type III-B CRISPR module RAMP protein Cmr4 [Methylobacter sp.]